MDPARDHNPLDSRDDTLKFASGCTTLLYEVGTVQNIHDHNENSSDENDNSVLKMEKEQPDKAL